MGNIKDEASSSVASELDRIEEEEEANFELELSAIKVPLATMTKARGGRSVHVLEEPSKMLRSAVLAEVDEEEGEEGEGGEDVFNVMS
jgi:hypothetical protein